MSRVLFFRVRETSLPFGVWPPLLRRIRQMLGADGHLSLDWIVQGESYYVAASQPQLSTKVGQLLRVLGVEIDCKEGDADNPPWRPAPVEIEVDAGGEATGAVSDMLSPPPKARQNSAATPSASDLGRKASAAGRKALGHARRAAASRFGGLGGGGRP